MPVKKPDLDAAYAVDTPQDNLELYADWADTYDSTFAADMDYQMPRIIGLLYAEAGQGQSPVLDVGAGTGLVAQAIPLRAGIVIDALDLSPDMLRVAAGKGVYRKTIQADLTKQVQITDGTYGAILSSGTFTHGHVGPDALDELMRIARKGAVFVLGINKEHFIARGFEAKFAQLEPFIDGLQLQPVNIYGAKADAAHRDDQALVAVFRKR